MRCYSVRLSVSNRLVETAALLIALGVASSAVADEVYLDEAEAPPAVFPAADRFERREVASTPELRSRVGKRLDGSKPTIWEPSYKVATAFREGHRLGEAVVVEEIGKHRPITFVVGVDPEGKIVGVAVMAYREAYGGEIRARRFLDQYRGKSVSDPLIPSRDIQNITGATLSARAAGRAVKKAIAVLAEIGGVDAPPHPASPASPQGGEASAGEPARVREAHYVMGTILEITVDAPRRAIGREWIGRAVAETRRLDAELTAFRSDSALSRLNRAAGRGFQRVPPDLFRLVALSRDLSTASGGTFDISVAPLVKLWQRATIDKRWPSANQLAAARAAVGSGSIGLRAPDEIELPSQAMSLELGGVGKGYAADRMAEILRGLGASSALVNFGESSIVAVGPSPGEPAWPIWVRGHRGLDGPLLLRDMALSTSGSFGRSARLGSVRIGHVIDPRSGQPLREERQATVIAPSAAEAEAWSKALLIDPEHTRPRLAERPAVASLLRSGGSDREDDRFAALTGWKIGRR
jgi:FAD:protein FMN transferase